MHDKLIPFSDGVGPLSAACHASYLTLRRECAFGCLVRKSSGAAARGATAVGTHSPWLPLLAIDRRESATVRSFVVLLVFGDEPDRFARNVESVVSGALDLAKEVLAESLA